MKISKDGLDLIKRFEGFHRRLPDGRCTTYRCPANVVTIGWGCTEGIKEGMVWTVAEAEEGLRRELAKFERAVERMVTVELNQHEFDALVSFSYNCGSGALQKSTILKKLNAGDRRGAASEFKRWNKAAGRELRGLTDRRAREATLFLTPIGEPDEPAMPQSVEQAAAPMTTAQKTSVAVSAGAGVATGVQQIDPSVAIEAANKVTGQVDGIKNIVLWGQQSWPWLLAAGLLYLIVGHVLPRFLRREA